MVKTYKELVAWQKGMNLVRKVYAVTGNFPRTEQYRLVDQLTRAVVSVPSNVAEGFGRSTNKDFSHFLSIARGSLYEVITQLEIAQSLGYIDEFDSCNELAQEVGRMLTSLMKKYDSIRSTTTTTHYN